MEEIIIRKRHEARRRTLTVADVIRLTPAMIRLELQGDMEGFESLAPDDHIKLIFETDGEKPVMREYTPRAFDVAAGKLTLDFALHDAGPATDWAIHAKVGDTLSIGGPRGSSVIAPAFDWWLLIGDETALPAIGRRIEEAGAGTRIIVLGAILSEDDRQEFKAVADLTTHWVVRPEEQADDPAPVLEALKALDLPVGRGFVWIAAEAGVARALRGHMRDERGHPAELIKAAGYWVKGKADTSDKALE